jgi:hypothetical protein
MEVMAGWCVVDVIRVDPIVILTGVSPFFRCEAQRV